jgi:hypothetical protein
MSKTGPTCRESIKQICAGIGEELNSPRCRQIRSHIRGCSNCSAYLEALRKTIGLYRAYPTPKHSPRRLKFRPSRKP